MKKWNMKNNLRRSIKFHKSELKESCEELKNPGCGWYRIYTFHAERKEPLYLECENEELVLLFIDIGHYRKTEISQTALEYIRDILSFFQSKKKEMILRFAYDTQGEGLMREPENSDLIKQHMGQVGSVITAFSEDILTIQGIFVGSWGEMHSSRYLSERWMTELAKTMLEAVEYKCRLAVRKPSQWRAIAKNSSPDICAQLTLFNDGMFGNETDTGTYGTAAKEEARFTDSWRREDELQWQYEEIRHQIQGGEVLGGDDCIKLAEDMKKMHVSYLNSVYPPEILEHWKEEQVNWGDGKSRVSGYDYIGRHLGYRFVVRDACVKRRVLWLTIENCGFANICEETISRIRFVSEQGSKYLYLDTDARNWNSGSSVLVSLELEDEALYSETSCYLELFRKRDHRRIAFANEGQKEEVLLGQFGKRN